MTKVKGSEQDVYENQVLDMFYTVLNETNDCERAYKDACVLSDGIHKGGAFLGFEYNWSECFFKLRAVYEREVNK